MPSGAGQPIDTTRQNHLYQLHHDFEVRFGNHENRWWLAVTASGTSSLIWTGTNGFLVQTAESWGFELYQNRNQTWYKWYRNWGRNFVCDILLNSGARLEGAIVTRIGLTDTRNETPSRLSVAITTPNYLTCVSGKSRTSHKILVFAP